MPAERNKRQDAEDARRLRSGTIAGFIGGAAMLGFLMIVSGAIGAGAWLPVRMNAALFLGVRALITGAGTLVIGIAVQLVMGAVLGGIFSVLLGDHDPGALTYLYGIAYGLAILLVMTFIVLPAVDPVMSVRVRVMPLAWLLGHVVYGVALGLTPRLTHRAAGPRLVPAG